MPSNEPNPYTPEQQLALFKHTPRIETTSNEWQLYLVESHSLPSPEMQREDDTR